MLTPRRPMNYSERAVKRARLQSWRRRAIERAQTRQPSWRDDLPRLTLTQGIELTSWLILSFAAGLILATVIGG